MEDPDPARWCGSEYRTKLTLYIQPTKEQLVDDLHELAAGHHGWCAVACEVYQIVYRQADLTTLLLQHYFKFLTIVTVSPGADLKVINS